MKTNRCAGIALGLAIALSAPAALASEFTTVYQFECATGCTPTWPLLVGADGGVVGVTWKGGRYDKGVLYTWRDGAYAVLHEFQYVPASNGLVQIDGVVYGLQAATRDAHHGSLWSYGNAYASIALPSLLGDARPTSLVANGAGNMLFVTQATRNRPDGGLWSVTTSGEVTLLHAFVGGGPGTQLEVHDGQVFGSLGAELFRFDLRTHAYSQYTLPTGDTVTGFGFADAALFGTQYHPFAGSNYFRLARDGTFEAFGPDTFNATGRLVQGGDGALYGTSGGGTSGCTGPDNPGTGYIRRIDPATLAIVDLHIFCFHGPDSQGPPDGMPIQGVYPVPAGRDAYGATINNGILGAGTLFRFAP